MRVAHFAGSTVSMSALLLAALHEVRVVACAVRQRDEGIEQATVPVDGADQVNVGHDLAWLHVILDEVAKVVM